jgi:hypothetical protein
VKIRQAIKNLKWIQRVGTQPGDTLVFTIDHHVSQEVANALKNQIAFGFPGRKCVLLSDGIKLSVLIGNEEKEKEMECRIQVDGGKPRVWIDGVEVTGRVVGLFLRHEQGQERAAMRVDLLDGEGNYQSGKSFDGRPVGSTFEPWDVYERPTVGVASDTKEGKGDGTKGTGEKTDSAKNT